jgi:DNA-binding PadR family transcriptional regulator
VKDKLRHAEDFEKRAQALRQEAEAELKKIELFKSMVIEIKGVKRAPVRPVGDRSNRVKKSTWTSEVLLLVQEAAEGYVSYVDMKSSIAKGPLGPALEQSDKSFYGALLKLENQGLLVRHNAHAFTPEAYSEHIEEVKAGRRRDVRPQHAAGIAPLTDAVLEILSLSSGGMTAKQIIGALLENDDVKASVERNNTSAYNVLARLVKQHRVIKNEQKKTYRLSLEGEEPPKIGSVSGKTDPHSSEDVASLNGSNDPNGALL